MMNNYCQEYDCSIQFLPVRSFFNKIEIDVINIGRTLIVQNKKRWDKTKTKLTETALISLQQLLQSGKSSKDRQRFVGTIVLIPAPDWSNRLSNFETFVETQFESVFERRTLLGFAKLINTDKTKH